MSDDSAPIAQSRRLFQMSPEHFDYRLKQLEDEQIPRRMQAAELVIGQLQGEVTAIKEIARGIGVKLDSGVRRSQQNRTRAWTALS